MDYELFKHIRQVAYFFEFCGKLHATQNSLSTSNVQCQFFERFDGPGKQSFEWGSLTSQFGNYLERLFNIYALISSENGNVTCEVECCKMSGFRQYVSSGVYSVMAVPQGMKVAKGVEVEGAQTIKPPGWENDVRYGAAARVHPKFSEVYWFGIWRSGVILSPKCQRSNIIELQSLQIGAKLHLRNWESHETKVQCSEGVELDEMQDGSLKRLFNTVPIEA